MGLIIFTNKGLGLHKRPVLQACNVNTILVYHPLFSKPVVSRFCALRDARHWLLLAWFHILTRVRPRLCV